MPVRQTYVEWHTDAITSGARKRRACDELGIISLRTFQRRAEVDTMKTDGRVTALRSTPANALTEVERQTILELCNSKELHPQREMPGPAAGTALR